MRKILNCLSIYSLVLGFASCGLIGVGASVLAQTAVSVTATQTSIIQTDGPKQGRTPDRYFNVEGKSNGKYADFGVLRFDTTGIKKTLDQKLGAGKYKLTAVTLELTQSNARFTKDGSIVFYYSSDDKTDVVSAASPLKYPYNTQGAALHGAKLGDDKFVKGPDAKTSKADAKDKTTGSKEAPAQTAYDLYRGPGLKDLEKQILQGKTVTIVINEGDAAVAATWAGKAATEDLGAPKLTVKAIKAGKKP